MAKQRIKAKAVKVPQSREEASERVAEIGILQRKVAELEVEMNAELARVKKAHEDAAAPSNQAIEAKFEAVHAWAAAHREELCPGRKKTVKLTSGEISWRMTPRAVALKKVKDVIAELKRRRLKRFIRITEAVDKEAILKAPTAVAKVAGITIGQREEFVVKPCLTEIEKVALVEKAK